ncbi:hypothetical protein PHISCL_10924 [Aspergillus sclerotialis]|uniref:Uncharacterized protein n=1 Tax=Aspergillus sclerotialis TaxID=2070753 RepID=A0A3A2Z0U8_9EURO|nr:hypothetical protein PHISCL_10924 [Aspergillus sclerotialis]
MGGVWDCLWEEAVEEAEEEDEGAGTEGLDETTDEALLLKDFLELKRRKILSILSGRRWSRREWKESW